MEKYDAILLFTLAYVLDWLIGDPEWAPHPVRWMGHLIQAGEGFLRRFIRTPRAEFAGGLLLSLSVIGIFSVGSWLLLAWLRGWSQILAFLVSLYFAVTTLATRSLLDEASAVGRFLRNSDLPAARRQVARIVGRDTGALDEPEVTRAAIETLAESASDGIVAPMFYLAIGGVPAALAYKAVNTLDSMIGHRDERYEFFGKFAARLDDTVNFIPARLTALLFILAAWALRLDGRSAWRVLCRDGTKHKSPNAGRPEAAMAGALGVQLGGTNYYDGEPHHGHRLGNAKRLLDDRALRDALRMTACASLFMFAICLSMKCMAVKKTINNRESQTFHGGRVYDAARRWGIASGEVIDFSANINPLGPPPGVLAVLKNCLAPISLQTYPDSHVFIAALADKHGVAPDKIVVGPGSAALIFAALRAVMPATVLVVEPGFAEYFRACAASEAEVLCPQLTEKNGFEPDFDALARIVESRQCDLVILNSPHNPTGRLYAREELLALIDLTEANDIAVLLDEAFIDYAPQASLLPLAATKSRLIVLRSLTKFYAIPGLRVGYAVCAAGMGAAIRSQFDAWPISAIALEAGLAALAEEDYAREGRRINTQAREEFAGALQGIGLSVFPSAANFLLAKLPRGSGSELAHCLESSRVLIRQCDEFRGLGDAYIRLAVRSREDNLRLVSLIETWLRRSDQC